MGRRKIPLELIADEKSRNSTFQRRKEGLKKKLYEFTTLCDIDACMIIYGPYLDGRSMKLDMWPPQPTEVKRIINKYYKSKGMEKKAQRAHDLAHFLENRKRKSTNDDKEKLQRGHTKAAYAGWDHRMCHASYDQLVEILHSIDSRVDLAKKFTAVDKEKQQLMKGGGSTQKMIGCTHVQPSPQSYTESNAPGSHHRNMQLVAAVDHLQEPKPLNSYMPQNYMLDQGGLQTCPLDVNSGMSFTMMMLMDEDDYHDGSSSSTNNLQCTKPSIYYDPRSGLLENVTYNNYRRRLSSVGNCSPPNIQQQPVQQQFDPRSSGLLENVRYNNYRRMMSSVGHYSPPNIQQPMQQQQFDPRSGLPLENVAYNNYRRTSSVGHYSPPNIQQPAVQQQFVQRPIISNATTHVMMPSDHSPVNDYQLNENYYDFINFQMKNKRARY